MILAVYLAFGLYPFQFEWPVKVRNAAERTVDGGIAFPAEGMASTQEAPRWLSDIVDGNEFELRIRLRTYSVKQVGPARILSIARDFWSHDLTIGQDGSDIVVRIRRAGPEDPEPPPFRISGGLRDKRWHDFVLSVNEDGLRLALDGTERVFANVKPADLAGWSTGYRLIFGNELIGERPWLGEIESASILLTDDPMPHPLLDTTELPESWWRLPERLHNAFRLKTVASPGMWDVLLNVFGFVPFGAFLRWRSGPEKTLAYAMLCGAALSLSIECSQIVIAGRYPSVVDLSLNTLGAGLGWLYPSWLPKVVDR
jgi:hypothetical protein